MRLRTIMVVAAMLAVGCSHVTGSGSEAQSNPAIPDIVQVGGSQPHWVEFPSDLIVASCGYIAGGFDTHVWADEQCGISNDSLERIAFDGSIVTLRTPTRYSGPAGLTKGPNGRMWFAESGVGQLGEITMPAGPITEFPLLHSSEQPVSVTTGNDGNIWFIDGDRGIVGKMSSAGVVTEFQLAHIRTGHSITAGPDGNVWFTGSTGASPFLGYVGRITPTGTVTEYQIPSAQDGAFANGIAVGSDGNLWVAAMAAYLGSGEIVKVTRTGQMTEFPLTRPAYSIAPNGAHSFFFTTNPGNSGTNTVGEINISGEISFLRLPQPYQYASAYQVTVGPDGNSWFLGYSRGGQSTIFVHVRQLMRVSPSPLTFNGIGQSQTITVTEANYKRTWTAASSNVKVATVAPGNSSSTFVVTSNGSGNCTVTVNDTMGNSFLVPVTVP